MKVLFDQNIPRNLVRFLPVHDVRTSAKNGLGRVANGALLKVAEESGFEILLTADQTWHTNRICTVAKSQSLYLQRTMAFHQAAHR